MRQRESVIDRQQQQQQHQNAQLEEKREAQLLRSEVEGTTASAQINR
jgi:hypothetical protein